MIEPFIADSDFTLYVGDVRDVLAGLPDESVHCVVTSPPYWGLRDYGATGQLGLEATPDEYVANMEAVFREVRRVLRRDGTCWLNLGDSYAAGTSGRNDANRRAKAGVFGDGEWRDEWSAGAVNTSARKPPAGLKPKDLVGIPWRVAFALQADGWYLRADVIWSKPNPMPESVTDRPTKAHEYLFLLTRSPRYFYDADAIREPAEWARWGDQTVRKPQPGTASWIKPKGKNELPRSEPQRDRRVAGFNERWDTSEANGTVPNGRNRRSVWEIATEPYSDAHFATFPQALVEPCVKAGTSERGCCPVCGAPWERETDVSYEKSPVHGAGSVVGRHYETGANNWDGSGLPRLNKRVETTGWRPSCDHDAEPVPCTVLDPFMGSGTTALVARRLGRRSIGIELNADYAALAARRLQQLSLLS